jgi:hypothetical protein
MDATPSPNPSFKIWRTTSVATLKNCGQKNSWQSDLEIYALTNGKRRKISRFCQIPASSGTFFFQYFSFTQLPLFPRNPLFPRLQSGHPLFQRPSPQKQFPSSQPSQLNHRNSLPMTIAAKLLTVASLGLFASSSQAITILLDYSHDSATDNFFTSNATAKAALEKARDDIQNVITSGLGVMSTDTVSGVNGSTTATYNFSFNYTNPSTGAAVSIPISTMGMNQTTVFVGMRELSGATLGQGGPGGTGISIGGSGLPGQWPGAVNNANAVATTQRLRGAGPVIQTFLARSASAAHRAW